MNTTKYKENKMKNSKIQNIKGQNTNVTKYKCNRIQIE